MAKRFYPEKITHWSVAPDGYGGFTFSTPNSLNGKWENKQELMRDGNGDQVVSNAVVFLESDVKEGDYLYRGDTNNSDPTSLENAHQVRKFISIPGLRGLDVDRRAML